MLFVKCTVTERDVSWRRRIVRQQSSQGVVLYSFYKPFILSSRLAHTEVLQGGHYSLLCEWVKLRFREVRGPLARFPKWAVLTSAQNLPPSVRELRGPKAAAASAPGCLPPEAPWVQETLHLWSGALANGLQFWASSLFSFSLHHLHPRTLTPGLKVSSCPRCPSVRVHLPPCRWFPFGVVSKEVESDVLCGFPGLNYGSEDVNTFQWWLHSPPFYSWVLVGPECCLWCGSRCAESATRPQRPLQEAAMQPGLLWLSCRDRRSDDSSQWSNPKTAVNQYPNSRTGIMNTVHASWCFCEDHYLKTDKTCSVLSTVEAPGKHSVYRHLHCTPPGSNPTCLRTSFLSLLAACGKWGCHLLQVL